MKIKDYDSYIDCKAAMDKFQHRYEMISNKCKAKGVNLYQNNLITGIVGYILCELILENYFSEKKAKEDFCGCVASLLNNVAPEDLYTELQEKGDAYKSFYAILGFDNKEKLGDWWKLICRVMLIIDYENAGEIVGDIATNYLELFKSLSSYIKKINKADMVYTYISDTHIIKIQRSIDSYFKLIREWAMDNVNNDDFDINDFMSGKYEITYK